MRNNTWARPWLALVVIPIMVVGIVLLFRAARHVGGTTFVTPQPVALIGTWTDKGGATLVFAPDETVVASNMPAVDGPSPEVDGLPGDGTGTWRIEAVDAEGRGGVLVMIGNSEAWMSASGDPAHLRLFAYIGDPDGDNEFTFTKQS